MRRRSDAIVCVVLLTALAACAPPKKKAKKKPAADPTAAQPAGTGAQRTFAPSTPSSFVDLAKTLDPSVVTIKSTMGGKSGPGDMFPGEDPTQGTSLGSGFVIDQEGYILTNNHVVEGGGDIRVILSNGDEYPAKIVGVDEKTDIGLLKIDAPKDQLVPAKLGDSDQLEVGEWVVAIGNPFGLSHTVTAGIVSAKNRTTKDVPLGPGRNYYWNFIQTDASINPGNSGGPLINTAAEVIGINTAIDTRGGGIGFAIPINMAKQLLPILKQDGGVTRAWLGVYIQDVTKAYAQKVGLDPPRGVLIADVVAGGPADKAGLHRGDVVLTFDGQATDPRTFAFVASTAGIDRDIELTVWRDGGERQLRVHTEKQP